MGAIDSVAPTANALPMEIGVAARPFGGASVSGDQYAICPFPGGLLLVVVDGLGHGEEAAVAGRLAIATVEALPQRSLGQHFEQCNSALTSTRGAVMSAATIDFRTQTMIWAAIGNVDAALFRIGAGGQRTRHSILMIGGVVGSRLSSVRSASLRIERGDTIVFATDGIRSEFGDRVVGHRAPQALADDIMAHCGKNTDDALVLVARWQGDSHS